ncbi:hypothetical protein [uncultured Selenomonas sp.]|uniref:hypothetical protein n=1 Tax=uncultured Selenomonas sp. TaxID=159275 RepID=UPI0025E315D0|nr:hypothetical protein [uncultured Selenomonas sp.]
MRMFKHFALVALLAMFLTGIGGALGTSEAKAMTLGDLAGNTYRVTETSSTQDWVRNMRASIVRFEQNTDGDYTITVVKPSHGTLFDAGDALVNDMYVMDGVIHCTWNWTSVADPMDAFLYIYNGGQTLKVQRTKWSDEYLIMRKI